MTHTPGEFTLEDFREQLRQMLEPGVMMRMLSRLPGMDLMDQILNDRTANAELRRMVGIIDSMTHQERRKTNSIDRGRRSRIARGAGVLVQEVEQLLRQFETMAPVMKSVGREGFFVSPARPKC
jgi:signal recognition particle subunit SRP54